MGSGLRPVSRTRLRWSSLTNLLSLCPGAEAVKFSQSGLTNLLATIAPPIAEHEVIEIWLTHDMAGYEGVDGLVYRGLSKVGVDD